MIKLSTAAKCAAAAEAGRVLARLMIKRAMAKEVGQAAKTFLPRARQFLRGGPAGVPKPPVRPPVRGQGPWGGPAARPVQRPAGEGAGSTL